MGTRSQFTTFWQMACGLGLPAAAAAAAAAAQAAQTAGGPRASFAFALGGGLFAAAGGIWANLYAGKRQKQDDAEEAERARLFNHDLAKAVAKSIATLLGPLADDEGFSPAERGAVEASKKAKNPAESPETTRWVAAEAGGDQSSTWSLTVTEFRSPRSSPRAKRTSPRASSS